MLKYWSANLTRIWYGQTKYTPTFSNMLFIARCIKASWIYFLYNAFLIFLFYFNCGLSICKYFRSWNKQNISQILRMSKADSVFTYLKVPLLHTEIYLKTKGEAPTKVQIWQVSLRYTLVFYWITIWGKLPSPQRLSIETNANLESPLDGIVLEEYSHLT